MAQRKFFTSFVDIRPGEWRITLLLFSNIYLLLLTYYLLKPVRDAVFLVELGPAQLPFVFILIAFIMIPFTTMYAKASRRIKLNKLIIYTLITLIINLILLRWLLTLPYDWVPYLFYAWVSIFGALTTSQFWLLANTVYTATEAKRLFAVIGLGGILGAWSGGEITSLVITQFALSTENLLLLAAAVLVVNVAVTAGAWSIKRHEMEAEKKRKGPHKGDSFQQAFKTIKSSKHLLYIVAIISIAMIVSSLVDFQFKTISTLSFQDNVTGEVDKVGLTGFLGTFYGRLSMLSILIQLFISNRMLRILGVGGIILFLPLGLLLGTGALLGFVGLTSAVLLRGADGALKNSIDKTGRELLFLPVPGEVKKQTKVFIDMFVDRWARGIAGGLLLLCLYMFNFSNDPTGAITSISLIVLVLLLVWIIIAVMVRKEYVNTFRLAIQNREIDQADIRIDINEASTIKTLIHSLRRKNEREVEYALDMLRTVENEDLVEPLTPLIEHPSGVIRKKALRLLLQQKDRSLHKTVTKLLEDDDIDIRCDAMFYLSSSGTDDPHELLQEYLSHDDPIIRVTVLFCVAEHGTEEQKQMVKTEHFDRLLNESDIPATYITIQLIRAIGRLRDESFKPYLRKFISEGNQEQAIEAIKAIGRLQDHEFLLWLIECLDNRKYRLTATRVLAEFGEEILPLLHEHLMSPHVDISVKKFIPRVMAEIPSQQSTTLLLGSMENISSSLKYFVIKALNRLHVRFPHLILDKKKIDRILLEEIKRYYKIQQVLVIMPGEDTEERRLLDKALREKLDNNLERIFRLMGLRYPAHDIYSAYTRITGSSRTLRASAIEFLDNLLSGDTKRYLLPILDDPALTDRLSGEPHQLAQELVSTDQALLWLLQSNDNWLRSLAIFNLDHRHTKFVGEIRALADDNDPLVKETALYKLKQFS